MPMHHACAALSVGRGSVAASSSLAYASCKDQQVMSKAVHMLLGCIEPVRPPRLNVVYTSTDARSSSDADTRPHELD